MNPKALKPFLGLLVLLSLLAPTSVPAQTGEITRIPSGLNTGDGGVEFVSQVGGEVYAVALDGKTAYIGAGPRLVSLDITIPNHISKIGQSNSLPGFVLSITVADHFAYVAVGNYFSSGNGLCVLDVSNPGIPILRACIETPGLALDVDVAGQYAYVASYDQGIRILDISDPGNPFEAGYYDTPGTTGGVDVVYPYAYVGDGGQYSGLRILDVSNPGAPEEISLFDTTGFARDVQVQGNYAYVADGETGLRIINIADPHAPYEAGGFTPSGTVTNLAVEGNVAVTAGSIRGAVYIIDISDPNAPSEVAIHHSPGSATGLALAGEYLFVADHEAGLRMVGITLPASPAEVGSYLTAGSAVHPLIDQDYVYSLSDDRLRIVNISRPEAPVEVASLFVNNYIYHPYLAGDALYLTGSSGLNIVDISNPASPEVVGNFEISGRADDLAVLGNNAYVIDWENGLVIIEITDPSQPSQTALFSISGVPNSVSVDGSTVYITSFSADSRVLHILDVSDPSHPSEVGSFIKYGGGSFNDVYAIRDTVYLSDSGYYNIDMQPVGGGLLVLDVSEPNSPEEISFFDTPEGADQILVSGSYAFITDGDHGLYVIDVSDPASPFQASFYNTPGSAVGASISGNYLFIGDGDCGLLGLWFAPSIQAAIPLDGGIISSPIDKIQIEFPPGGFTDTVTATLTSILPGLIPRPDGLFGIGKSFELTAFRQTNVPLEPVKPYTVTIQYSEKERNAIIEESLGLYFWNATFQQWEQEPSSTVNTTTNQLTATPGHLSLWAVFGETRRVYIPTLRR